MDAKRRAFVSHSALAEGAERVLISLVEASLELGERPVLVIPTSGPVLDLIPQHPNLTTIQFRCQWWMSPTHSSVLGLLKSFQALTQGVLLARRLASLDVDQIVSGSTVVPAPLVAGLLLRVPTVSILGESVLTNPTLASALPKRVIVRCIRSLSTACFAVSEYVSEQFGNSDGTFVPFFEQLALKPTAVNSRRHIKAVMLGTVSQEKGQTDAVGAVADARAAGVDIDLELFGTSTVAARAELEATISKRNAAGYVRYHGPTMEPLEKLLTADISLVCSRNEAFGRVTLESILVGTPVIGYARGGTLEILRPGGGLLVEPNTVALANALRAIAFDSDLLASLEAAARMRLGPGPLAARDLLKRFDLVIDGR